MRNLDLNEITDKISDYASDIKYSDREHLNIKIPQFLQFLDEQPISKRTTERIAEDFSELKKMLSIDRRTMRWQNEQKQILQTLKTREYQGAFGYFEILNKNQSEKKYSNHFIELANEWYDPRGNYDKYHEFFNTYFFEPFIEILEWYFRESKIEQEKDYFSKEEIIKYENNFEAFETQLLKLGFGQQIIFDEAEEIKELILGLNKKNWTELIKGKFENLIIDGIISLEMAETLIKTITGENLKLR